MTRYILVCNASHYPYVAGYVDAPDAEAALACIKDSDHDPWYAFPMEGSAYRSDHRYAGQDDRLEPVESYLLNETTNKTTGVV